MQLVFNLDDRIVLLSEDGAFANAEKDGLHPDLVNDLKDLGCNSDSIILVHSLKDLFDHYVSPGLKLVKLDLNIEQIIEIAIKNTNSSFEWAPGDLGLPTEYESPSLDDVYGVSELNILDVRELSHNQLVAKAEATLDCAFSVFIYKPDWYAMEDDRLSVYDIEWNDHYIWGGINLVLECELNLKIDTQDEDLYEVEVLYARPAVPYRLVPIQTR